MDEYKRLALQRAEIAARRRAAELARTILDDLGTNAHEFTKSWIGFNALYNEFAGRTERSRFTEAILTGLTEAQATWILECCTEEVIFLLRLPPGNMRYQADDGRFRERAKRDMASAADSKIAPTKRLAHLVSAVYQIRCNLFHGNKNPVRLRSRRLLAAGTRITENVVHALIENVEAAEMAANKAMQVDGATRRR